MLKCVILLAVALFAQGNFALELFTDEPLSTEAPKWSSKVHSSPPGPLWDPQLKTSPLPTNAWWSNLGT